MEDGIYFSVYSWLWDSCPCAGKVLQSRGSSPLPCLLRPRCHLRDNMRLYLFPLFSLLSSGLSQNSSTGYGNSDATVPISRVGEAPSLHKGVTFGVPWPRGEYPADETSFELLSSAGESVQAASWVTGYWPDGSVKWSAHAVAPSNDSVDNGFSVRPVAGDKSSSQQAGTLVVEESGESIQVNTGALSVAFASKSGFLLPAQAIH